MLHDFVTQFWPSTIDGLSAGAIYALVALGYTMVYGVLRLINFAHSEVFMVGTFAALFVLSNVLDITHPITGIALVGVLLAMAAAAMISSGVTAVVLERVAYRPLRRKGASRLAALISAIGASFFLQELFALFVIPTVFHREQHGRDQIPVPHVMDKEGLFSIGNGVVRNDKLLVLVAAVVMMVLLDQLVNRTKVGRGIRATAQDPETAVLMGINIDRIILVTFVVGGAMAGVAAALYALEYENIKYNIGFLLGIKAFTAAVMGGIGNLRGALLGGLLLGLIEFYGASVFGSEWRDVIAFTVLVVVLMFRPTGILGEPLQKARA
ncbi:MAG TPA: branched-chain amino acid ABC transporter permease [Mycobacteriales bacterium]|nr:branched-chain amino acid ABC transporter permease [Mycobacteriales bacterium]